MDTTHKHASSVTTPAATLPDALRLGETQLVVTDIERSLPFYEDVIGLTRLGERDGEVIRLGTADGTFLVELREQPGAARSGRHAGLYHLALLYPTRAELANVVQRIAVRRTMIDGASDHGTHEAIYLPDPDGNGLELAADRPREQWPNLADIEEIRPRPLDLHGLLATIEGEQAPARAADGLVTGHLHLHVGDIPAARAYYVDVIGFEEQTTLPVAGFVSAGGYHHHLAYNTWRGVGVGPSPEDSVGLGYWTAYLPTDQDVLAVEQRLLAADAPGERRDDGVLVTQDPWRNVLHVAVDPDA